MKFFFSKTDSLYKIFKTLEKIPSQKAVQMFIDPEHPFFENQRWGKQMVEYVIFYIMTKEKKKNLIENILKTYD